MKSGLLLVVSGPAGVGKGTVVSLARERNSDIVFSVSMTSREPRPGEKDGENYFFVSREKFLEMVNENMLLEWVEYCGNFYGTPRLYIEEQLEQGNIVLLEIEVEGARNIKQQYPECVSVFITPPTVTELRKRITKRGTESPEIIEKRMQRAIKELEHMDNYDYIIKNESVEESVKQFLEIIEKERKANRNM
ncbi:MAG: guanylate kinase [Clostridiaceae bacterium]|jgi:guanylate kinase|nr:guanylate kinase [Clostridiaceae bacterium]